MAKQLQGRESLITKLIMMKTRSFILVCTDVFSSLYATLNEFREYFNAVF